MKKFFPYPLLSLFVLFMWLLLSGFTVGQFLLGSAVCVIAGLSMVHLQPEKTHIRNWHLIPKLFFRVLIDITRSNLAVAYIILTRGRKKHQDGFMIIPLDLKNRMGLIVLAGIITSTPGTVWVGYDNKKGKLLLHVLDLTDEVYWRNLIKKRYESLLLEIFV